MTFAYTGAEQTFTVPAGVGSVQVLAVGGTGGEQIGEEGGGEAAQVSGQLSVTPGEVLYVEVGGRGEPGEGSAFNGGGNGCCEEPEPEASGGGGASDVRTSPRALGLSPDPRLLVAGGGGGEALPAGGFGGAAGNHGGASGQIHGGGAGTQSGGGAGGVGRECPNEPGANGTAGSLGTGGEGGVELFAGGSGGGGYYGGGGGGGGCFGAGGGGGGGSSLVPAGGSTVLAPRTVEPIVEISYVATPPTVTHVMPAQGPAAGGTIVTIKGTNFTGATSVKFGSTNATSFTVESATKIKATSPAATSGKVDVTVTTPEGTSAISSADHFKFGPPTVTGLTPTGGPKAGGTPVTITGTGFALGTGLTTFKFGMKMATSVNCTTITTCKVVSPQHAVGTINVKATVSGQHSPANPPGDQYTYN